MSIASPRRRIRRRSVQIRRQARMAAGGPGAIQGRVVLAVVSMGFAIDSAVAGCSLLEEGQCPCVGLAIAAISEDPVPSCCLALFAESPVWAKHRTSRAAVELSCTWSLLSV